MICEHCGKEFVPGRRPQKYCEADCRIEALRIRARDAMRERRASFRPRPCADCQTPIVGRALRCPACKAEDVRRRCREFRRAESPERKAEIQIMRQERRKVAPEVAKAAYKRKWQRVKDDPELKRKNREAMLKHLLTKGYARRKAKLEAEMQDPEKLAARREYQRLYAAKRRAEKLKKTLENLINETDHSDNS